MNSVSIRKHSNLFRASGHAFDLQRDQHAVVEASAGTGKTFALEELVLEFLLEARLEARQLLLMTFTEKATTELRERIRSRLTTVLQTDQSDNDDGPCWTLTPDARTHLQSALLEFETLPVLTIHGFCNRVLTEFAFENRQLFHHEVRGLHQHVPEALRTLLRREVLPGDHLASALFQELALQDSINVQELAKDLATLLGHSGPLLPEPPLPEDVSTPKEQYAWLLRLLLPDIRNEVHRLQTEQGTLDYQDMIQRVYENVQPQEGAPSPLTQALRNRYQCAIVDEFQDTDPLQWGIFREVFLKGDTTRLVVIGDPKQAIYGFRSADVHTYLEARQTILAKTGRPEPFTLDQNFRSNQQLIFAFNELFQHSHWFDNTRPPTEPNAILYRPVACGNPKVALTGSADRRALHLLEVPPRFTVQTSGKSVLKPSKTGVLKDLKEEEARQLIASLAHQTFVGVAAFDQALREVLPEERWHVLRNPLFRHCLDTRAPGVNQALQQAMAQEILTLQQQPPDWCDKSGTTGPLKLRDICILTRTRSAAVAMGKELERVGLPYTFYRQAGLFQSREALEWLDLLNAIRFPTQRAWVQKAWLTRFFNLSLQQLSSAWEAPEFSKLRHRFLEWNQLAEQRRFVQLLEQVLHQTQVLERELLLNSDSRSVFNYQQLLERLSSVALARNYSLNDLAAWLQRMVENPQQDEDEGDDTLRQDAQKEAVQLMTIHTSKGLEFPVVFLDLGGVRGASNHQTVWSYHLKEQRVYDLLPDSDAKSLIDQEIQAENQRLLYVALTRAAGRLYLPYLPEVPETATGPKQPAKTVLPLAAGAMMHALQPSLTELVQHAPDLYSKQPIALGASKQRVSQLASLTEQYQALAAALPQNPRWLDQLPEPTPAPEAHFAALRKAHLGFQIGSFSRWHKRAEESRHLRPADQLTEGRELDEPAPEVGPANEQDRLLPGGVQTGNFLHTLLEQVEYESAAVASPDEWLQNPRVQHLFEDTRLRYQLPPEASTRAAELLWHTLQNPLLKDPELILHQCSERLHELEFHFPLPEPETGRFHLLQPQASASSTDTWGQPWTVRNGFLQGSIDLVLRKGEKTYFLDWKSNRLSDYRPATLEETVRTQYQLQLEIYLIAVLRWLGIRTEEQYTRQYGGAFYVFLRGMADTQASCFFPPPPWEEVQQLESRLGQGSH